MTPSRFQRVLAAVVLIAVAGCGSDDFTKAPPPSTATGPTYAEGVIEKKVGEPAGLNCPDDPNKSCDLNFAITAIQQGAACDADRPAPDQQFLRVDIEAFSSGKTFEFPDSADALLLQHWTVDGADGARHELIAHPRCGDGAAPVSEPVAPGTRARARVVVTAPKPAEKLRISWLELNWEWPISGTD